MTYRFEEEDYENTYILEDYYCTNPFCDCNHVTLSFKNSDDERQRISFLLNFSKVQSSLPNQPTWTKVQETIVKNFVKAVPDELMVLFKQRYFEAKAYGEKNPGSYLIFEAGTFMNYYEMFPRNQQQLDFLYNKEQYFAEDSYNVDPREDNKNLRLAFYKFELDQDKQPPIFNYTYYFNESAREAEDAKLNAEQNDLLLALNSCIPDLFDILKGRYKETKKIGEQLIKSSPKTDFGHQKISRNDLCPCGSGKKYKKCCALKVH